MSLSHKLMIIIHTIVFSLFLAAAIVPAEQRYIVDTVHVSLREGPGSAFKAIKTLQTGQSFEVLESRNGYVRVRTEEGDEGWVPNQYTDDNPPDAILVKQLNDQIKALTEQNEQLLTKTERLADQLAGTEVSAQTDPSAQANESAEIKRLESELAELTNRYNQLAADAEDIMPIAAARDQLQEELKRTQESLATLQQEKPLLGSRENIYWFLAGSGVFLLGWMVGKVSCRRPRHSLTL